MNSPLFFKPAGAPYRLTTSPRRLDGALRVVTATVAGFLGVTAVAGGLGLLFGWISPGEDPLHGAFFDSYVIPGLALIAVGVSGLVASAAALLRHRLTPSTTAFAGLMIICYEAVELEVIGFNVLQVVYLAVGVALIALAVRLSRALPASAA